jgi:hypothetical protein
MKANNPHQGALKRGLTQYSAIPTPDSLLEQKVMIFDKLYAIKKVTAFERMDYLFQINLFLLIVSSKQSLEETLLKPS